MKNFVSVTELAKSCGVSKQYIHQCMREGKVKPLGMIGKTYMFSNRTAKKFKEKYFPAVSL